MRTPVRLLATLLAALVVCALLNGAIRGRSREGGTDTLHSVRVPGRVLAASGSASDADLELQKSLLSRELKRRRRLRGTLPGSYLRDVFTRKASVVRRIERQKLSILNNATLDIDEKRLRLRELDVATSQLEGLEALGFGVLKIMDGLLNETYSAVLDTRSMLSSLITQLQFAALNAQADFNSFDKEIKEKEREMSMGSRGRLLSASAPQDNSVRDPSESTSFAAELVGDVLHEVSSQADRLEDGMRDDIFEAGQEKKGSSIEMVIKIPDDEDEAEVRGGKIKSSARTLMTLVDFNNNQYVLTRPSDLTAHYDGK